MVFFYLIRPHTSRRGFFSSFSPFFFCFFSFFFCFFFDVIGSRYRRTSMAVCFSSSVLGVSLPSFFFFTEFAIASTGCRPLRLVQRCFFSQSFSFQKVSFYRVFCFQCQEPYAELFTEFYRVFHRTASLPNLQMTSVLTSKLCTEFLPSFFLFCFCSAARIRPQLVRLCFSLLFFSLLLISFLCVNKINKMDGKNSKRQKPSTSR